MKAKLFIVFMLILLLISTVSAFEITPTRKIYDFEAGKQVQGSFTIIKNENQAMKVAISTRGELADKIKLKDFVVDLPSGALSKEFSYAIEMPSAFDKPGLHEGEIVVVGVPDEKEQKGAFVGTSITLSTKIRVRVPYPGKYAETALDVQPGNVNEQVTFVMPVTNLGTQDIRSALGTVQVLGPTNALINTVSSQEAGIPVGQSKELLAKWLAEANPGIYSAKATINYDGQSTTANKTFSVGNMRIEILGAEVKSFRLGSIAKIFLTLKSEWNQEIENVYAELYVYSDNEMKTLVYDSKSTYINMQPLASDSLPIYWDTQGLVAGSYTAKVILHYADRSTETTFRFVVGGDSFEAQLLSGKVTERTAKVSGGSLLPFIFMGVFILIAFNIGLFIYFRRTLSNLKK